MKTRTRLTISLDPDLGQQIRAEAARDGVDVSTWLACLAQVETTRRAYAAELADRQAKGIYSATWLDGFAERRAVAHSERTA